jgi:small subunit ribosomal protein S9
MVAVKKDAATGQAIGTGRRKTSVARVRVKAGTGKISVNDRDLQHFFVNEADRRMITDTLSIVNQVNNVDVEIKVSGGGSTGQAGACKMGLARALVSYDTGLFQPLRDGGFLTRDSRMKERKKYGLRGARRGVQFSKR